MQRTLAIARLTWKSAFRYRLFWVMAALLVAAVVGLPMILKDDGTASGLVQILLTYTLSSITVLLGFATLWLSCGTLARDIEDCQIQVVCSKPVGRWQVWFGKLIGILALNAMLLAISGLAVYLLLGWRAGRLPGEQQEKLRNEIFVARAAARERPPDLSAAARQRFDQWLTGWRNEHPHDGDPPADTVTEERNLILGGLRSEVEELSPTLSKEWQINLSTLPAKVRSMPMQLRVKFNGADTNMSQEGVTYTLYWRIGPIKSQNLQVFQDDLPAGSFQDIPIQPLVDSDGILTVFCANPGPGSVFFPMEDGFAVLYHESTFGVNYMRGLAVILCWLTLLSAVGLACASFLSFPVAAFCSLAILFVGLSGSTLSTVEDQKTIFAFSSAQPTLLEKFVDTVTVPVFSGLLKIVNLVQSFSPVDDLSSGLSITWGQLARAFAQIVLLMGGIFAVAGIILFNRRELAAAQSNA